MREFLARRYDDAPPQVTVLGAGKFGSAIAETISSDGTPTTLVTRSRSRLDSLRERLAKRPKSLHIQSLERTELGEYVFVALASADFPETVSKLALRHRPGRQYISLSKGLTPTEMSKTPYELLSSEFGDENCAVVSGPSLAGEMTKHATRLVVASDNEALRDGVSGLLHSDTVRCQKSDDPHGVEFAGISKNVSTLGFHASRAASDSLNTAGTYASQLISETWCYAATLGAQPDSFIGTAGIGDLMATSHADSSRNVQAGKLLGKENASASDIEAHIGQVVESFHTVPLLTRRLERAATESPAIKLLSQRVLGEISRDDWVRQIEAL